MQAVPQWEMPATGEQLITWIFGALFAATLVAMVVHALRTRSLFPVFLFLGSGLTVGSPARAGYGGREATQRRPGNAAWSGSHDSVDRQTAAPVSAMFSQLDFRNSMPRA